MFISQHTTCNYGKSLYFLFLFVFHVIVFSSSIIYRVSLFGNCHHRLRYFLFIYFAVVVSLFLFVFSLFSFFFGFVFVFVAATSNDSKRQPKIIKVNKYNLWHFRKCLVRYKCFIFCRNVCTYIHINSTYISKKVQSLWCMIKITSTNHLAYLSRLECEKFVYKSVYKHICMYMYV